MPNSGTRRRQTRRIATLCAGLGLLAAGCGQIQAPLPPSANLPQPASDFRALRRGEQVRLRWTTPRITSDGLRIHGPIMARLCIWPTERMHARPMQGLECPHWQRLAGPLAAGDLPQGVSLQLAHIRPASASSAAAVRLAIAFANQQGKAAGWSDWQLISLLPVSPPPARLWATVRHAGIELHWHEPRPSPSAVRLYRRELPKTPVARGKAAAARWRAVRDLPGSSHRYLDREVQRGRVYQYTLRSLAGAGELAVASARTQAVTIEARQLETLPAPVGLVAVLGLGGEPAVHLAWQPVASSRLAGYDLYRQQLAPGEPTAPDGASWHRVNHLLLLTPTGKDKRAWKRGPRVRYAVTSVDRAGRQSAFSAAVTVQLPMLKPQE